MSLMNQDVNILIYYPLQFPRTCRYMTNKKFQHSKTQLFFKKQDLITPDMKHKDENAFLLRRYFDSRYLSVTIAKGKRWWLIRSRGNPYTSNTSTKHCVSINTWERHHSVQACGSIYKPQQQDRCRSSSNLACWLACLCRGQPTTAGLQLSPSLLENLRSSRTN